MYKLEKTVTQQEIKQFHEVTLWLFIYLFIYLFI